MKNIDEIDINLTFLLKSNKRIFEGKKTLYIHGLGSNSNSETGNIIKEYLKDYCEVVIPTWDLTTSPFSTLESINEYIKNEDFVFIIGSSLGGFYAWAIKSINPTILINPCLKPSVEIPKLISLSEKQINEFKEIENKTFHKISSSKRKFTIAAFGKDDELFNYKDFYDELNFNRSIVLNGQHKLPKESIKKILCIGCNYFNRLLYTE